MDDIIDLEMEKIDLILAKVDSDPEPEEVSHPSVTFGSKSRKKTLRGRRTGLGTTAEGDMIAAMGLRYGTPEATDFSVSVHRAVALAAYTESVEMASQRGAFEVYDTAREANNPYIQRLAEADPAL